MLLKLRDDIRDILVNLSDNNIQFKIRDSGIVFDPFPNEKFFSIEYDGLYPYIKDSLLTLEDYLSLHDIKIGIYLSERGMGENCSYRKFINRSGKYTLYNHNIRRLVITVLNNKKNESNIKGFMNFINELYYSKDHKNSTKSNHFYDTIHDEPTSAKSTGMLALLNGELSNQEIIDLKRKYPKGMPLWAIKRAEMSKTSKDKNKNKNYNRFLVTLNNLQFLKDMAKKGPLMCEYCNAGPLVIYDIANYPTEEDLENPNYRFNDEFNPEDGATCDHRIPQSKGGDKFNYDNLAVCCYKCNQEKKDMNYEDWLNSLKESKLINPIEIIAECLMYEIFDNFDIEFYDKEGYFQASDVPKWQFDGNTIIIGNLESRLYTDVINSLYDVKDIVKEKTNLDFNLKYNVIRGKGFITISYLNN